MILAVDDQQCRTRQRSREVTYSSHIPMSKGKCLAISKSPSLTSQSVDRRSKGLCQDRFFKPSIHQQVCLILRYHFYPVPRYNLVWSLMSFEKGDSCLQYACLQILFPLLREVKPKLVAKSTRKIFLPTRGLENAISRGWR